MSRKEKRGPHGGGGAGKAAAVRGNVVVDIRLTDEVA